jgi:hypothetical protein
VSDAPGWTGNGSAGFAALGTLRPSPNPAARGTASGLHHPLALALTLTRPFRLGGKESVVVKAPNQGNFGRTNWRVSASRPNHWWNHSVWEPVFGATPKTATGTGALPSNGPIGGRAPAPANGSLGWTNGAKGVTRLIFSGARVVPTRSGWHDGWCVE